LPVVLNRICDYCKLQYVGYGKKFCSHACKGKAKIGQPNRGCPKGKIPWNKGMNKATNQSVASASQKNRGKKRTKEQCSRISEGTKNSGQVPWNKNPDQFEQMIKVKTIKMMRGFVGRCMSRLGTKKESRTIEELGYSPNDLRMHLERMFKPDMSWENHGLGKEKWHVDHVKRIADFPLGTPASVVNSLTNLQPLWQHENLKKG